MNKQLAKIISAKLEIKNGVALSFCMRVSYEVGSAQFIGGMALDTYDKGKDRRIGTAYGCEMIRRLLIELNVDCFSEMKNKIVWVLGTGEGLGFNPAGIQRLIVDGGKGEGVIFEDIGSEFI